MWTKQNVDTSSKRDYAYRGSFSMALDDKEEEVMSQKTTAEFEVREEQVSQEHLVAIDGEEGEEPLVVEFERLPRRGRQRFRPGQIVAGCGWCAWNKVL